MLIAINYSDATFAKAQQKNTLTAYKGSGDAGGALVRESGAQIACRWGWGGDFCNKQIIMKVLKTNDT